MGLQPRAFLHIQFDAAHDPFVVQAVGVPDPVPAVAVAVGVAAEPYGHAGFELADAQILDLIH